MSMTPLLVFINEELTEQPNEGRIVSKTNQFIRIWTELFPQRIKTGSRPAVWQLLTEN